MRGDGRPAASDRGSVLPQSPGPGHEPRSDAPLSVDELVERLWQDPARLEPGFVAVERDLAFDGRTSVDLLGRDDDGRAVVLLVGDGALAAAVGRAAAALAAFHQVRTVLDHFLASAGMDVALPPRLVLVAPRFDDPRALGLEPVLEALGAELREADRVRLPGGGDVLHLSDPRRPAPPATADAGACEAAAPAAAVSGGPGHAASAGGKPSPVVATPPALTDPFTLVPRVGASASESASTATAPVVGAAEAGVAAADDGEVERDEVAAIEAHRLALLGRVGASAECRRLYLAASDSIRSLSSVVESGVEDEGLVCRVDGARLATLLPRGQHLDVRVGEEAGSAFEVRDDAGLNASLNAVFSHYFQHFSGRR